MPRTTKPKSQRRCKLTNNGKILWIIQGKKIDLYSLERIEHGFLLTKVDETEYQVLQHEGQTTCCCKAGVYRRVCRHVQALRALGMLKPKE